MPQACKITYRLTPNARQDLFQHGFLLVITIMKLPPPQCAHSMHGVYTHSCAQYRQYGIRKKSPCTSACKVYAASVAPVVGYDLGLAPPGFRACLKLVAHCNRIWSVSRISCLRPTCATLTSQCGLQNPQGSCSKLCIDQLGTCRTVDQKVQKSALTSGTTVQLAVLAES